MIHSISSADNASRRFLSPRPIAAKKSFTIWTWLLLIFFCSSLFLRMGGLRFSSKADIVIEFAEFEQGFDVFPCFRELAQVSCKDRKCFGVAVQSAFFHESRPGPDFPWRARGLGVGLNPFEDFPVTFAGCQFLQQGIGIEAKKFHQVLVG